MPAKYPLPSLLSRFARRAAVLVTVLFLAGCASSEPSGSECDQVCEISNGAAAAGATTHWRIESLSCGQLNCFTRIAFFADGTGEITSGTSNCAIGSTPSVVTFTWTQTGPTTMLLSGSAFSCAPNPATTSGTVIASFTSINGSVGNGTFTANLNGGATISAALVAGTF